MRRARHIPRARTRTRRHAAPPLPAEAAGARAAPSSGGEPGAGAARPVLLAWALDRHGGRVHVGELDPRTRRERAPFSCLACAEELVPRLGRQRARHFAHRPGSTCPLTHPETALHLNAKERLLALCQGAFSGRHPVRLAARCPGCRRPVSMDLVDVGDHAVPEGAVPGVRADVLVTRAGAPALALEIRVSHAVGPEKEAALAALALPAVEIDAREEWEEERAGFTEVRVARGVGLARCPSCALAARAASERQAGGEREEIAELEAYRARGLLGPPAGPVAPTWDTLPAGERGRISSAFRCPECGTAALRQGERLIAHPCPRSGVRPVAWRGFDGALVELDWWRRGA